MIFSVYDYNGGRYRYYESLAGVPATGFFRKARHSAIQGSFVPEAFAVQLPADARPVGEGPTPRGYIADDPRGLAAPPVPGEAGAAGSSGGGFSRMTLLGVAALAFFMGRAVARRGLL